MQTATRPPRLSAHSPARVIVTRLVCADNRLNQYSIASPAIQSLASLSGVTSLGFFVDSPGRILPNKIISTNDMTTAKCALNCADCPYFGTEWGRECYCGSDAPTVAAPSFECSMACSGNDNELCGASEHCMQAFWIYHGQPDENGYQSN
jgi:hypothetical protein